jgi:hypothetical protein
MRLLLTEIASKAEPVGKFVRADGRGVVYSAECIIKDLRRHFVCVVVWVQYPPM